MDKNYFISAIAFIVGAYCAAAPFLPAINLLGLSLSMGIFGVSFFFASGIMVLHSKLLFSSKIYALTVFPLLLVAIVTLISIFNTLPEGFVIIYLLLSLLGILVIFYVISFLISKREISKFQKGIELAENGKYKEAMDYFDNLLQSNSNDPLAWSGKAIILAEFGKYEEALEYSNRALDVKMGFTKSGMKRILFSGVYNVKGIVLSNLKKYDEALGCFDEALKLNSANFFAWGNKGDVTAKLGNYSEAVKYYNKAVGLNSKYNPAWVSKGFALSKLENYPEAVECYDKSIELDSKLTIAWLNKGSALEKLGKHKEAVECYEKVVELHSKQEPWKLEEALRSYNGALETDPEEDALWFGKGVVFGNLGKNQEALECLDKALELNTGFEVALKVKDLFSLDKS